MIETLKNNSYGRRDLLFAAVLLPVLLLTAIGMWRVRLSSDTVMYSFAADDFVNGARLYIDIIDANPPLIFYIHAVFSLLARFTGVDSLQLFAWTVLAGGGVSSFLVYRSLRKEKWAWAAGNASAVVSLLALYLFEFGQREHIFSLAFLPYIAAGWSGNRGYGAKVAALLAATMACLKPGFVALLVVFEALEFFRRRQWRFCWWAFLLAPLTVYLLHFLAWPADARQAYWLEVVPVLVRYYRNVNMSAVMLARNWGLALATYLPLSLYLAISGFRRKEFSFTAGVLALVALAWALVQHKGWDYHLLPVQFLLLMGVPCVWYRRRHRWADFMRISFTCALLAAFSVFSLNHFRNFPEFCEKEFHFEALKRLAHRGESVLMFSPQGLFSFPVYREAGLRNGSRYLYLLPVAFYMGHPPVPEEQAFIQALRADIDQRRPDLIVFPNTLPLQWPLATFPVKALEYAMAKGVFDVHDPRYSLVVQDADWTIFRRKPNQ